MTVQAWVLLGCLLACVPLFRAAWRDAKDAEQRELAEFKARYARNSTEGQ